MFFDELEQAFEGKMNPVKRLKLLKKIILEARAYAKVCNQIRE